MSFLTAFLKLFSASWVERDWFLYRDKVFEVLIFFNAGQPPIPQLSYLYISSLVFFFLEIAIAKDNIGVNHVLRGWMAA